MSDFVSLVLGGLAVDGVVAFAVWTWFAARKEKKARRAHLLARLEPK